MLFTGVWWKYADVHIINYCWNEHTHITYVTSGWGVVWAWMLRWVAHLSMQLRFQGAFGADFLKRETERT